MDAAARAMLRILAALAALPLVALPALDAALILDTTMPVRVVADSGNGIACDGGECAWLVTPDQLARNALFVVAGALALAGAAAGRARPLVVAAAAVALGQAVALGSEAWRRAGKAGGLGSDFAEEAAFAVALTALLVGALWAGAQAAADGRRPQSEL